MTTSQKITNGVSFIKSGAEAIVLKLQDNASLEAKLVLERTQRLREVAERWSSDTPQEDKKIAIDQLVELFKTAMEMK